MPNRDFNQLKQDVKEVAILMFAKNLAKDSINGNQLAALFYDAADKATDLYDTAAERCDWDGIINRCKSYSELYDFYNYITENDGEKFSCTLKARAELVPDNYPLKISDDEIDNAIPVFHDKETIPEKLRAIDNAIRNQNERIYTTYINEQNKKNETRNLQELREDVLDLISVMSIINDNGDEGNLLYGTYYNAFKEKIQSITSKSKLYDLYTKLVTTDPDEVNDTVCRFYGDNTNETDEAKIESEIPSLKGLDLKRKVKIVKALLDTRKKMISDDKNSNNEPGVEYDHNIDNDILDRSNTSSSLVSDANEDYDLCDYYNKNNKDEVIRLVKIKTASIKKYNYTLPFIGGFDYRCIRACTDGFVKDIEDYHKALDAYNKSNRAKDKHKLYDEFIKAADKCQKRAARMRSLCEVYLNRKRGKDQKAVLQDRYIAANSMKGFADQIVMAIDKEKIKQTTKRLPQNDQDHDTCEVLKSAIDAETKLVGIFEKLKAENSSKWSFNCRKFTKNEINEIAKYCAEIYTSKLLGKEIKDHQDYREKASSLAIDKDFINAIENKYLKGTYNKLPDHKVFLDVDINSGDPIAIAARKKLEAFTINDAMKCARDDLKRINLNNHNDITDALTQDRLATIIVGYMLNNGKYKSLSNKNVSYEQFNELVDKMIASDSFKSMYQNPDKSSLIRNAVYDKTGERLWNRCYKNHLILSQNQDSNDKVIFKKKQNDLSIIGNDSLHFENNDINDRSVSISFDKNDEEMIKNNDFNTNDVRIMMHDIMTNPLPDDQLKKLNNDPINAHNICFDSTDKVSLPYNASSCIYTLQSNIGMTKEEQNSHLAAVIAGNIIRIESNKTVVDKETLGELTGYVKGSVAFKILTNEKNKDLISNLIDYEKDPAGTELFRAYHRCYLKTATLKRGVVNNGFKKKIITKVNNKIGHNASHNIRFGNV
ncbi:MAG: hypothetical protein IKH90_09905 [Ruminococcus sp.]|nr:hypothetical protein [Ruminococcus sp.]